ncbi:MAG: VWA domain-containing protein [Anaerolineae bacterium]|nr:VWA domain-containing protein [Anaerolineae bacterium]
MRNHWLTSFLLFMLLLTGCDGGDSSTTTTDQGSIPANAIQIDIIYAPESQDYMPKIMQDFNDSYRRGINPVTGQPLAEGERPIFISGKNGSSGTVMQGIVNALIAPSNSNVERPVIFQPSVSHWLALANSLSRRQIFNLSEARPTALAPVVMAIWESRLNAIRQTVGYDDIGWEELLQVLDAPNGWQDFGIADGRRTVFYGHTDPFVSSTGLSTLIAEFYAAARENGFTGRVLTMDVVMDEDVRSGVREIEQLIRHYSRRTTEFKNYIAQGPEYLDFVALEENDLIAINRGLTQYQPPERLVALYPKEGTFWHEHPFGIVNGDWVTAEEQAAARVFTDYVLLPDPQAYIMSYGFRPANPDVPLGFPFEEQYGVTVEGPATVLDVPDAEVIVAIQESWTFVKKQADIMLLIDISGSMAQENRLEQAKQAALAFIDQMETNNRVGLTVFDTSVTEVVPLDNLERNQQALRQAIQSLQPQGGTALYDATVAVMNNIAAASDDGDRIRAVLVLSDGEDTESVQYDLLAVTNAIRATRNDLNPVIVIPVAYGSAADTRTLSRMAEASNTTLQSGDPNNIQALLELIGSYF